MNKISNILLVIFFLFSVCIIIYNNYDKHTTPKVGSINIATTTISNIDNAPNNNYSSPPKDTLNVIFRGNLSTWLWDSPRDFSEQELIKMFEIAKRERITTIYLRMDDYIDAYGIKDKEKRIKEINSLDDSAQEFISLAKKYNIKTQALGGGSGWANPEEIEMAFTFFDAVIEYNKNYPSNKFVGIQFDVESNNSDYYKIDKKNTLVDYLNFVQDIVSRRIDNNLLLGFAIPILYGRENNPDAKLVYSSKGEKLVAYHLLDILNQKPNTYVVLMDYRNFAEGVDGSIYYADILMRYINQNSQNVKLVVGQETDNVQPSKITFYGTSKLYFRTEMNKIISKFLIYPEFDGIAVHHIKSFIDL